MDAPEQYIGNVIEVLATEVSKNKDGGFSLSYPRFIEFRDKSVDDVDRIVSKGKGFEIVGRDYFLLNVILLFQPFLCFVIIITLIGLSILISKTDCPSFTMSY